MTKAQQDTATADTSTITWKGVEFTVPDPGDWDAEALEYLNIGTADSNLALVVRGILGTDQWRRAKSLGLKVNELSDLLNACFAARGLGSAGESSASTGS